MSYVIHYTGFPSALEGYSDGNCITDSQETKTTSGYIFALVGAVVSWKSTK